MKENIKSNKSKPKILLKISICFAVLLIVFLLAQADMLNRVYAADSDEFCYLSDIPIKQSSSGWGNIILDKASNGQLISVKVENGAYSFEKGIWAHATSTVIYDLSNYSDYKYFTSYIGLNTSAASSSNGVKFSIYTSADGKNWEIQLKDQF